MYEGLKNLEVPKRTRRRARVRTFGRTFIGILTAVTIAATAIGGFTYFRVKNNLGKGVNEQLENLASAAPKDPINILIVGSDSRAFIDKGEQKDSAEYRGPSGQRADTIILLHVSGADKNQAVLVHFPRDLRVEIPGRSGHDKINAAYAYGGANLLIKTVKAFSGLEINHYVEVNFASFRQIVDSVGGVKIYVDRKLKDKKSGLNIPKAGCIAMDGKTALAFVRARNIDPTADLGRIQRQQLFMRALLRKVKTVGFLLDPGKIIRLSKAVGEGLTYDKEAADIGLARSIAAKVAGFDQRRVDFRLVPSDPDYIGRISYVVPREEQSAKFFKAIADDTKLPPYGKTAQSVPRKKDVSLEILNGTGKPGLAGLTAERLRAQGYDVEATGNARDTQVTTITYQAGAELKADLVARYFKGSIKTLATTFQAQDVVVTLGVDRITPSGSPTPTVAKRKKSARAECA